MEGGNGSREVRQKVIVVDKHVDMLHSLHRRSCPSVVGNTGRKGGEEGGAQSRYSIEMGGAGDKIGRGEVGGGAYASSDFKEAQLHQALSIFHCKIGTEKSRKGKSVGIGLGFDGLGFWECEVVEMECGGAGGRQVSHNIDARRITKVFEADYELHHLLETPLGEEAVNIIETCGGEMG
ncbi:hypothetical protein L2E82_01192 [Cichorium intybus]|uniref:Uncharacterized protein n=1 Tax=Cichorium intybus TaxID=13427 RepID=A0ACB9GZA7_CICIN|nr:hypothetical protein L2E82_01192 [Cichorium intybus]